MDLFGRQRRERLAQLRQEEEALRIRVAVANATNKLMRETVHAIIFAKQVMYMMGVDLKGVTLTCDHTCISSQHYIGNVRPVYVVEDYGRVTILLDPVEGFWRIERPGFHALEGQEKLSWRHAAVTAHLVVEKLREMPSARA